ncbi:2-oxoacid:acceptor oxidoreductase family protein [Sulfoacidibacillus thermotolerans]|uniref:Ferredoxin n=1 Tax=Sulfoacidibacillus thermotolerans TaxID=1765684 RepID=A0A2U3D6I3_SULT2|nr:2-oxoacid:acceptor oxidoreductase family protein [Sulfoacidibacillus thermotolerans]PWI56890.1 ferredoxin [Sulfoacidibacillus thermotolerans]
MTSDLRSHTNEAGFYEIRMESIGGLGANLAGKMLAEAGVLQMGLNGSNFSSYGSEKKGTPVKTFIRFAAPETEIRSSSPIEEPHIVAVFHESLLRTQNCIAGLQPDGTLIVNTAKTPEDIRQITKMKSGTIVCIDALQISVEEKTRVNTAMLGAICHAISFLDENAVKKVISETFGKKYPALAEANLRTFDRGFREGRTVSYEPQHKEIHVPFAHPISTLGYETQPLGGAIINPGNSISRDLSASRSGFLPAFEKDACIHCAACDQVCPDMCFVWESRQDERGRAFQYLKGIDYQYCKGCLRCISACPTDALQALREIDGYADENRVKHSIGA